MKKTSLLDAFEVKSVKNDVAPLNDYDVFKDKVLLDELRTKIIEKLIDSEVPQDSSLNEFIIGQPAAYNQNNNLKNNAMSDQHTYLDHYL